MKEETLKRLLSLIEKTGDRLVITDPAGEHPYVLMGLDHYERLVVGEWQPETAKRDPAPPVGLPVSSGAPLTAPKGPKPMPIREVPLWKPVPAPEPGAPTISPPVPPNPAQAAPAPATPAVPPQPASSAPSVARPVSETPPETEGEEQFYLEPLE